MWHLSQVLLSHIWKWFSNQIAKQECGLGLQVTRPKNLALKALLLWRAHNSGHELWASVLENKYFSWAHNGNRWLNVKGSRTWNELRRGWAIFAKGSHRTIQNGSITRVWLNEWIARMSLMDLTMGPLFTPWIHSFCPRCVLWDNELLDVIHVAFVLLDHTFFIIFFNWVSRPSDFEFLKDYLKEGK